MRVSRLVMMAMLPLTIAAKGPKIPSDAPYCAREGMRQVFVAPMGEPFRAAAGQPYPSALWFAQADLNHDGYVQRTEFLADAQRFFRSIDTDHDGRLTPEEVAAYEQNVAPEIALYQVQRIQPGDGKERRHSSFNLGNMLGVTDSQSPFDDYNGPMGAGRYGWLNTPEPVASADLDVNRLVSEAEFLSVAGRRFDTLDKAQQGAIRLADMPRTPAQISIEGPCRPRPRPKHGTVTVEPDQEEQDQPK